MGKHKRRLVRRPLETITEHCNGFRSDRVCAIRAKTTIKRSEDIMKKECLLLSIYCLITLSVYAQNAPQTDLQRDKPLGPVRSVKTERSFSYPGETRPVENSQNTSTFTVYDKKGNKIEDISFDGIGQIIGKRTYHYNESGKPDEITMFDKTGAVAEKLSYAYPGNNETVESYFNSEGTPITKRIQIDGDRKEPVKIFTYDAQGVLLFEQSLSRLQEENKTEASFSIKDESGLKKMSIVQV